nr:hypothetical protein BaRGS_014941 [Batillaria attramentaria]
MPDGKSWVKGVEAALTWQDAKGACEEDGAHLVRLQTQAKRDDLKEIVDQTAIQHNEFWVDANDIATEGVFRWGDGSPVDTVLFAEGEPDTSYNAEEDCVLAEIGIMLADRFCDNHHYYVCEL